MIEPVRNIAAVDPIELPTARPSATFDFGSLFERAVGNVDRLKKDSHERVDRMLRGENEELHEVVLAAQRADLSFELFLEVRNKVVQAYQEVMRMQM